MIGSSLDFVVLLAYLGGVTAFGIYMGRGQTGGRDYFLGRRELPWVAVMLSVVATETSTLTFLSIPGVSYLGTLAFLQLTFGYLLGRIVVARVLLPAYYRGEIGTAYALLEDRFGVASRRTTSGIFMVTRLLADSVRLFATAIPLALVTGWSYPLSIGIIGVATLAYTLAGGLRAVVWVDVVQMGLYLFGAAVAAVLLQGLVVGGWSEILSQAGAAGKLAVVDVSADPAIAYTLWAGLFGGAFLSMASHGTDQLIVQRLLGCRDLKASQRALVGSGIAVIAQFGLFLLIGAGLWVYYQGAAFERSDEIFATFIVQELPSGLRGLIIAGIFAAAMSSLSSSINSLASATTYDFWAVAKGDRADDRSALRFGRIATLVWAGLLIAGAIVFIPMGREAAAVEVALAVASVVYGGLLGAFGLGVLTEKADQRSTILGMGTGIGLVGAIWLLNRVDRTTAEGLIGSIADVLPVIAWPWFVVIGSAITFAVGWIAGRRKV